MRFILFRWGQSSSKIDFCKLKFVHISFFLTFFVQWRQLEIGCILFSLLQHLLTQEQSRLHPFLEKKLSHLLSVSVFPQFSLSLSPFLSSTFSVLFKYSFSIRLFPLPIHLSFVSCHGRIMSIDAMCFLIGFDMIVTSINTSTFSHAVQIPVLKHSVSSFFHETLSFFRVVRFCCHWMVVGFPAILRPPLSLPLSPTPFPNQISNHGTMIGARRDNLVEFGEFCSYVDNLGEKEPQWRVLVKNRTRK